MSQLFMQRKNAAVFVSLALLATPVFGDAYGQRSDRATFPAAGPSATTTRPLQAFNRSRQNIARAAGGANNALDVKGAADTSRKRLTQTPTGPTTEPAALVADARSADFDKPQKQLDIEQRNLDRRLAQAQKVREQGEKKGNSALVANADRMEKAAIDHYEKRVEQIVGKLGVDDSQNYSAPFSSNESVPLSNGNSVPFTGVESTPYRDSADSVEELVPLTSADASRITPIPERSVVKPSVTPRETARPWWKPKKTDRP